MFFYPQIEQHRMRRFLWKFSQYFIHFLVLSQVSQSDYSFKWFLLFLKKLDKFFFAVFKRVRDFRFMGVRILEKKFVLIFERFCDFSLLYVNLKKDIFRLRTVFGCLLTYLHCLFKKFFAGQNFTRIYSNIWLTFEEGFDINWRQTLVSNCLFVETGQFGESTDKQ